MTYDAEQDPAAADWLALDEAKRIVLIENWHRHAGIQSPRARLHAAIHAVVENQIAISEPAVLEAMARLRAQGLTRLDAIHAVGSVVAGQIIDLIKAPVGRVPSAAAPYRERLRSLNAADWRGSGTS